MAGSGKPNAPEHVSTIVAGEKIDLQDNAKEVKYPTPRAQWPDVAHAPSVLGFRVVPTTLHPAGGVFKLFSENVQREKFVNMAVSMAGLGKGPHVPDPSNGPKATKKVTDRPIAYADAIAIGERASLRAYYLGNAEGASSCGMFIRSLYKMIGVKDQSYLAEYVAQTVMTVEQSIAKRVNALVTPGKDWEEATDDQGKVVLQPRMPKVGDAVYFNDVKKDRKDPTKTHPVRHVTLVTGVESQKTVRRADKDKKIQQFLVRYYYVVHGGQTNYPAAYPDDGGCMAIKHGVMSTTVPQLPKQDSGKTGPSKWDAKMGGLKISPGWIDLHAMADACDDEPIIEPVRKIRW